jgi:prophage regulatory protein
MYRGKTPCTLEILKERSFMKILKQKEVVHLTGLSKVTIWRLEQRGAFPTKISLSPNRVGWLEDEVLDWITSRPRVSSQQDAA